MHASPAPHPSNAHRPIAWAILGLAGPVMLARLGVMAMGVADTIVVGRLAPQDLAAFALGWAPGGVIVFSGIGLLVGAQILSARAIGEGAPERAGAAWRRGLVIASCLGLVASLFLYFTAEPMFLLAGISPDLAARGAEIAEILAISLPLFQLFAVCDYFLEGIQKPTGPSIIVWAANALNLGLLFLLVPELGALGAAWATVIARAGMLLAIIALTLRPSIARPFALLRRHPGQWGAWREQLSLGAAAMASFFVESSAFSGLTIIAGRISEAATAAYQITLNLLAVVFMVALGFATAGAVLVAESVGAQNDLRRRAAQWTAIGFTIGVMAALGLAVIIFGDDLAAAITVDPTIAALLPGLFLISAAVFVFDGVQGVAAQVLRAQGDVWFPTASHLVSYTIIMLPLGFLLGESAGRGPRGLIEAIAIASIFSGTVLLLRLALRDFGRAAPAAKASLASHS